MALTMPRFYTWADGLCLKSRAALRLMWKLICKERKAILLRIEWLERPARKAHSYTVKVLKVKKHIKQGQGHEGGIFSVEAPLHVSNVQVIDPVTGKPCKVGIKYLEDGTKVRVSRGIGASGSMIPRPEILKIRSTPRPTTPCGQSCAKCLELHVVQHDIRGSLKRGLKSPSMRLILYQFCSNTVVDGSL
ncbi:UNVERIFIED_CONTAM: 50S ribosomal protein L24 [Sesamum calycinum]|uniref:50S ribosomal protein L24 n=1 Tax=Sesamum calycinum TaxID=2727403 RepID=A0AAW2J0A8_9LAMI